MIRLSGKEPERDIAIEFTGARPGEKLHEELWNEDETAGRRRTRRSSPLAGADRPRLARGQLGELERLVEDGETLELVGRGCDSARAAAAGRGDGGTCRRCG